MKIQRLSIVLTVINLLLLTFSLAQFHPTEAQGAAPVLRGRALEIVDKEGRVRASINVHPAGPSMPVPDGKIYPETVILRLIDPNGRPSVKLGASEQGSGLGLGGDSDLTYVALKAEGASSSLKLTNKDGREQLVKP
jgi:hypothetical protein